MARKREYTDAQKKKFLGHTFEKDVFMGVITKAPHDLIVYKKTLLAKNPKQNHLWSPSDGYVTTLLIKKGTLIRWSMNQNKCRATQAHVIKHRKVELQQIDGKRRRSKIITNKRKKATFALYDRGFKYETGKTVKPENGFDKVAGRTCGGGIHFFLTEGEALRWSL